MTKRMMLVLTMSLATAMPAYPQTTTASKTAKSHKKAKTATKAESEVEEQLREMRAMEQKLQAQINDLKQQVADRDARLNGAAETVQAAQAQAAQANEKAAEASSSISQEDDRVKDLQQQINTQQVATAAAVKTVADNTDKLAVKIESPATLHYKGVEITPIGFFAAESVYRQRSLNSDINTPFNATLFPGAAQAHTSEFNFTGRQSRIGALVVGTLPFAKLGGYFEADFLSAGVTSNENQSNSYTLRQRQIFGQVLFNSGFSFYGGQMWSLVTETKTGVDPRTEVLPQTPDAAYHVGFSWARQPGIRIAQKVGIATYAMSLEEGQNIFSASNQNQNFFFGAPGVSGGLYNAFNGNYTNNVAPDVILKASFDPKFGHFEFGGIARFFRDRYYPGNVSATSIPATAAANDTKTGGGFFANAHIPMTKYFTLGLHVLDGTGVGRYGTSTLPDTTVHPDGTLAPIKSSQGLLSLEFHPQPKLDLYGYAGGEYAQRTLYRDPVSGKLVGYAPITNNVAGCNTEYTPTATSGFGPAPANCSAATRALLEGSAGFTYRFYQGPKGRFQYSMMYSYLQRAAWTGTIGTGFGAPKGTNNMIFSSFRYYIP